MTEKQIWDALDRVDVKRGGSFKRLPNCLDIQPGDLFVQQQQDIAYPRNIFAVLRPTKKTSTEAELLELIQLLDVSRGGVLLFLSRNHKILPGDLLIWQKGARMEPDGLIATLRPVSSNKL